MAKIKQEGTFCLDGLIEGPCYGPEDLDSLDQLVKTARSNGISLRVSNDGGRFSIMPDLEPIENKSGLPAEKLISNLLQKWLSFFDDDQCSAIMSTLRSVEYVPNNEIQVLYGILPNGTIHTEKRAVAADTIAPPEPMDPIVLKKIIIYSTLAVIAVLLLSTLFVPYKEIGGKLWNNIRPYEISSLKTTSSRNNLISIETVEYDKKNNLIIAELICNMPEGLTPELAGKSQIKTNMTIDEILTLETIARQMIVCDLFDDENKLIQRKECRLVKSQIPGHYNFALPFNRKIARIDLQ